MSIYAVLVNLRLPFCSYPPPFPPSHISASAIPIFQHLFRVSDVTVSIVPRICFCRSPFLCPTMSCPNVTSAHRNLGFWAPRSGRSIGRSVGRSVGWSVGMSVVCVPIRGTSLPFQLGDSPSLSWAVCSSYGTPYSVSQRHRVCSSQGRHILVQVGAACF